MMVSPFVLKMLRIHDLRGLDFGRVGRLPVFQTTFADSQNVIHAHKGEFSVVHISHRPE